LDIQISQNHPFLTIPRKKLDEALEDIASSFSNGLILTHEGAVLTEIFQKYYLANIPVDYWFRDMDDFIGPNILKKYYIETITDIKNSFKTGKKAMFAGKNGIGKTTVSACILKRAVESNKYSGLYVNLADIVHVMLSTPADVKNQARDMLLNVDFLVIDEFDTRFMATEAAADLFGRILEPIMRTRIQNRMPLFFCTNSIKVEDSFSGPLQASIGSLLKVVNLIPVIGGKDVRENVGKGEL
jgi:DNA replication protein DnaC